MSYLFQKGVSERDIIGISQLVEICRINTDFSNPGQGLHSKHSPQGTKIMVIKSPVESEYWKQLIDDLKKYGNIKLAIKEHLEKRDKVKEEIDDMQKQKQGISVQCQNGIYFIKELYYKMTYFKEFMNLINKELDNKIKASSKISDFLPIFIICNNSDKNKEKGDNKDNRN